MSNTLVISSYVSIVNYKVILNNKPYYRAEEDTSPKEFFRSLYGKLGLDHSKFFKMDAQCQLAFISNELLLQGQSQLEKYPKDKIGIVLSNSASSLDTDRRYYDTIKTADQYYPSPSTFVYTLPSIMSGEIAIKNGITGENNFFVSEVFNPELITSYVTDLFSTGMVEACISGWVNLEKGQFESFMCLVELVDVEDATNDMILLSSSALMKLYEKA